MLKNSNFTFVIARLKSNSPIFAGVVNDANESIKYQEGLGVYLFKVEFEEEIG